VGRCVILLAGVGLILSGLNSLSTGGLHYPNHWGGPVYAPFAIVIGIGVLVTLAVKWRTPNDRGRKPRR
jgi:hypothetical protein